MRIPRTILVLAVIAFAGYERGAGGQERVELFADDFSRFPPGVLSAPLGLLNGAIQEYHYLAHRGVPTRPWRNPIVHLDAWAAGDEGASRTSSSI